MNIKLLVVGRTVKGFVSEATEEYTKRLKHYINFKIEVIQDVKNASSLSSSQLKRKRKRTYPKTYLRRGLHNTIRRKRERVFKQRVCFFHSTKNEPIH